MFKKLLFLSIFFVSLEAQAVPIEAKIWKQTKKAMSIYSKAMATVYLLTTLIELDILLSLKYQDYTLYWNMVIMHRILPREIFQILRKRFMDRLQNYMHSLKLEQHLILDALCAFSKQLIMQQIFSAFKWVSIGLFIDYLNKENKDENGTQKNKDEKSSSSFEYLV